MRVTWHGHSCFSIRTRQGVSLLVDPFLDNGKTRRKAADFDPALILLTHGHQDHTGSVLDFPAARVVCGWELGQWLLGQGVKAPWMMNIGGSIEPSEGLRIWMTEATHSSGIDAEPAGEGVAYGGNPCGFVVDDGETRLYVAGDTGLFGDMRAVIGEVLKPHAAIVPIGDVYTMGPSHAALAVEWLGVSVAVPCHYATFPAIEVDPAEFVRAVGARARVIVPPVDSSFELAGADVVELAPTR